MGRHRKAMSGAKDRRMFNVTARKTKKHQPQPKAYARWHPAVKKEKKNGTSVLWHLGQRSKMLRMGRREQEQCNLCTYVQRNGEG
jgi:hypothetical protein